MNRSKGKSRIVISEVEGTEFADDVDVGSAEKRGGKADSKVLI